MEYYNPIDRTSRRYAAAITFVVMAVGALLLSYVSIDVRIMELTEPPLEILFEEEPVVEPPQPVRQQSAPTDVRRDRAPAHVEKATKEQSVQTEGAAEKTQTINPNALFKPVTGNAEEVATGNRLAQMENKSRIRVRAQGTTFREQISLMRDFKDEVCERVCQSQAHAIIVRVVLSCMLPLIVMVMS